MRRTGHLGLSLLLILVLAFRRCQASVRRPRPRQPQAKTQPEYNAYIAAISTKRIRRKKRSWAKSSLPISRNPISFPTRTRWSSADTPQRSNWAKVMDAADRAAALPGADNKLKEYAYTNAMIAAQNQNNVDKLLSYGDKVLAVNPNSLQAHDVGLGRDSGQVLHRQKLNSTKPPTWRRKLWRASSPSSTKPLPPRRRNSCRSTARSMGLLA